MAHALAALAVITSFNAHAIDTFDPASNLLTVDAISVDGVNYQNVIVELISVTVLGVDYGFPGADTYSSPTRLLTLGALLFQGAVYYNVRVQLHSVKVLAATLVNDTPGTSPPSTAVTPTPAPVTGTLTAANTCGLANFQSDLMALINQARATSQICGSTAYPAAAPVAWNSKLLDAATGHSADMANQNYFSHTSLDGRTFDQRITAAGYAWSNIGENIAAGQSSVSSVMAGWMASAGHCANIMNSRFTEVGTACVINNSSTYRSYWTMNLGRP
jgi:uncharacterized protein YkwD